MAHGSGVIGSDAPMGAVDDGDHERTRLNAVELMVASVALGANGDDDGEVAGVGRHGKALG